MAEDMESRVRSLETWVEGHEKLCAERFSTIREDVKGIKALGLALLVGIIGWLAVQLWNGQQARLHALEQVRPAEAPR